MGAWNSRTVNPSSMYQSFTAPFPDLGGEDIHSGENRYHNLALPTTSLDMPPLPVGTKVRTNDGRIYCYVQAIGSDFIKGELCMSDAIDPVPAPVTSSADLLTITDASAAWTGGFYAGDYVCVDAGTGVGQTRRVVANDATTLFLDRPLATALDGTSTLDINRAYRCLRTSTTTILVAGVSSVQRTGDTNAIDENSYGWIQVGGWCDTVEYHAAVADGAGIVSGTTAGRAIQVVTDTLEWFVFGYSKGAVATAGDLGPALLTNCSLMHM